MDSSWQTSALNVYRSSFLAYCSVLIARLLSYHSSINVLSIRIHYHHPLYHSPRYSAIARRRHSHPASRRVLAQERSYLDRNN